MSFYGNILNRLDKAFSSIRVNSTSIEAEGSKDTITFTGENGITLTAEGKTVKIAGVGDKVITKVELKNDNDSDHKMQYLFTYADGETYSMDIPLDSFLSEAKVVTKDGEEKSGQFLKLTFKTVENDFNTVYIDMSQLLTLQENIQITGPVGRVTQDDIKRGKGAYLWECKNMTIPNALEDLLSETLQPKIEKEPSIKINILPSIQPAYEIGSKIQGAVDIIFDDGAYTYSDSTGVTVLNSYWVLGVDNEDWEELPGEIDKTISSPLYIKAWVTYSDGDRAKTNKGNDSNPPVYIKGEDIFAEKTIDTYREGCFYGTVNHNNQITSSVIRGLNKLGGNYSATSKTFTVPVDATKIIIACPKDKTGPSSIFNKSVNAEMLTSFNKQTGIEVGGADANESSNGDYAMDYNVWVFTPPSPYKYSAEITFTLAQ